MTWKIPFGTLRISETAKKYLARAVEKNWITEGENVEEFEVQFCKRFGWKYGIATSSGTTAGEVLWSAIREIHNKKNPGVEPTGRVITPACAFVATANVVLAASLIPEFVDVSLDTLNIDPAKIPWGNVPNPVAVQFVSTLGNMIPMDAVSKAAKRRGLFVIGDECEAHGGKLNGEPSRYLDAAIYSFYVAHIVVGGEGGIVCTNDEEIANLCRSIKSHGRPPGSIYFQFDRPGGNAKANDMCFAVALGSLADFDETFERRREIRQKFINGLAPLEDKLILYRDGPNEIIAPHGFGVVLRDEGATITPLYNYLESKGIQVKLTFGSIPTGHAGFKFMGRKIGDFPVSERIGRTSLHWGCSELYSDKDVDYVIDSVQKFFP